MMRRLSVSFFLSCASVLLAVGGKSLSFTERPMLAGRASLTGNGFVVSRTLGTANFSPELRLPVQLVYESASEKRGAFGFVWRSPQLESRAYFTKDAAVWTTPWGNECRFPLKDGALLPTTEWSASFNGESPETAEEWTFTGRNGKRGWTFRHVKSKLVEIVAPSGRRTDIWTC